MGNVILGHFPGYLTLVAKLAFASCFSIPAGVWNGMNQAARWTANKNFLNAAINKNDKFVFSHHALRARRGSYFFQELMYLRSRGVRVLPTQDAYVP